VAYGFIYFLRNPSMPGLIKIGMTTKNPRERMRDLSRATACPQPFELIAFFDVTDAVYAEREIHRELDGYRVNENREFFNPSYAVLQNTARQWIDSAEGCANIKILDRLAYAERFYDMVGMTEAQ
jgi:hypothetical protein